MDLNNVVATVEHETGRRVSARHQDRMKVKAEEAAREKEKAALAAAEAARLKEEKRKALEETRAANVAAREEPEEDEEDEGDEDDNSDDQSSDSNSSSDNDDDDDDNVNIVKLRAQNMKDNLNFINKLKRMRGMRGFFKSTQPKKKKKPKTKPKPPPPPPRDAPPLTRAKRKETEKEVEKEAKRRKSSRKRVKVTSYNEADLEPVRLPVTDAMSVEVEEKPPKEGEEVTSSVAETDNTAESRGKRLLWFEKIVLLNDVPKIKPRIFCHAFDKFKRPNHDLPLQVFPPYQPFCFKFKEEEVDCLDNE